MVFFLQAMRYLEKYRIFVLRSYEKSVIYWK